MRILLLVTPRTERVDILKCVSKSQFSPSHYLHHVSEYNQSQQTNTE